MRRRLAVLALLSVLLAAAWWLIDPKPDGSDPATKRDPRQPIAEAAPPSTGDPRFEEARQRIAERRNNRPAADRTRQRLRHAIPAREVDPPTPSPTAELPLFDSHQLEDRDFLRKLIEEQIIPVVKDCYALELETRPGLSGKITVTPTIVADEDIGAVAEHVELETDATDLDSTDLQECVVETTYALEFDPPRKGRGRQDVTFSIVFSGQVDEE